MSNKTAAATKPTSNVRQDAAAPAPAAKPTAAPATAATPSTPPAELPAGYSVGKNGKVVRNLTRFVSKSVPGFRAMVWADLVAKYGNPRDPKGEEMIVGKAPSSGGFTKLSPEQKAEREAAKLAEKAKFDAMTDEQKLAHAKAKREAQATARNAKKEAEKAAMVEAIKAEIKAGKIKL